MTPIHLPSAEDIRKYWKVDIEAAKNMFDKFSDYSSQRLAELDRRDRDHLDAVGDAAGHQLALAKLEREELNDDIYM